MDYLKKYIKPALEVIYSEDEMLFVGDLSERCTAFRFAWHLQNILDKSEEHSAYFVDCDYNSSIVYDKETGKYQRVKGKKIEDILENREEGVDGEKKSTGRFIDIIVHKRSYNRNEGDWSDLFCIELKKWNNMTDEGVAKDRNNLEQLTSHFGYKYGYHLIFGEKKEDTYIEIFTEGEGKGLVKVFE